jgi:hypothetical protein
MVGTTAGRKIRDNCLPARDFPCQTNLRVGTTAGREALTQLPSLPETWMM